MPSAILHTQQYANYDAFARIEKKKWREQQIVFGGNFYSFPLFVEKEEKRRARTHTYTNTYDV